MDIMSNQAGRFRKAPCATRTPPFSPLPPAPRLCYFWKMSDDQNRVHDTRARYRQSGVALSATIISLSLLLLKSLHDLCNGDCDPVLTNKFRLAALITTISAFFIQVFNYFGWRQESFVYTTLSNNKYILDKKSVLLPTYLTLVSFFIADLLAILSTAGFFTTLYYWNKVTGYF